MKNKKPTFWKLFFLFLKVSLFSFGGGNALFPMIKNYCVDKHNWITEQDIDDILIITKLIPGASSVEAIAHISYLLLKSKWKATLVTILSLLPHTLLFFVIFYLGNKFIPIQYLNIIYVATIPIIISLLLIMIFRYIKAESKDMPITIHWIIFSISLCFCVFVPVPWSMPIIIISFFALCLLIFSYFKKRRNNKKIKEV